MGFTKVTSMQVTSRTQISQLPDESLSHSSPSRPGGLSDVGCQHGPLLPKWRWPRTKSITRGGESAPQSHLGRFLSMG